MTSYLGLAMISLSLSLTAHAQFTGLSVAGSRTTVEQARKVPVDTYVTVTGNIVAHLREDYYTFRDETGNIRVAIEPPAWRNQKVGLETRVKLFAEVDRNAVGTIYLWVESLEIVK
jgi:uncharacterized protein (TIGR00156 family)